DVSPLVSAIVDDPVQLRAIRRAVLKRVLEAEARDQATRGLLVLVLEDLHHAHDDSLEIVEYLTAHVAAPILFVVTTRPELLGRRAGFRGVAAGRHTLLEVGPLPEMDAQRMMEQLLAPVAAGGEDIPQELIDAAVDMAGGNPALLEKMDRNHHDSGVLVSEEMPTDDPFLTEDRWKVNLDRLSAVQLPLTIQDAVNARLAALSSTERALLERAATMGSVFWLGGLVVLGRLGGRSPEVWDPELGDESTAIKGVLEDLVSRDYVLRMPDSTFPGEEEYVFKHNLERESLEKLIPAAESKHYHQSIADWLEFRTGVRSHEEHVARLAWHRERGGSISRAALTWIEAGDIARARYANAKAAECYQRGLELLGDDDARARLSALHHYGDVLTLLGQYDEALAQFNAMQALAYALDLKAKAGAAHNRIGRLFRESGRLDEATRHLQVGFQLFELAGDERGVASSLDDIGKLAWIRGDYAAALEDMRKALATRKRLGDRRSIALSLNNLGLVLQDSGHFKEALEAFEQSLRIRREIGDLVGVVTTLNNLGTVAQDQRDDNRAETLFQEALGIAREVGDRHKIVLVLTNIGETYYRQGDVQRAVDTLKESEQLAEEIGDRMLLAEAVRGLGKAYLLRGDLMKAREYTARAVQLFEQVRSKVQIGVGLRTLGEVTAAGGWGQDHVTKAKGYFLRSIALFEECGNEVELARTYRAYADFLRKLVEAQGDPALQAEAAAFDKRADDVFAKLRISAVGIDPAAFFS
ncbi:MAG: ATP-binding protein, partial [Polyangiales bacterium]